MQYLSLGVLNAGLSIERVRVRNPFGAISKPDELCSLHDASVQSDIYISECLVIDGVGNVSE